MYNISLFPFKDLSSFDLRGAWSPGVYKCSWRPVHWIPWSWSCRHCMLPNVAAGNWTSIFSKTRVLLTGSHLSSPRLHLFPSWLYHSHRLCHKLHYKVFILNIIEENFFFSAKMQILLPLQSIKTRSEERGFFLADAPSEGAETKLWRPDALKALGSLGSYEPLLDLEVFIEYPVI